MVRLQYTGESIYRGADEHLSISLTCDPGDVVEVSEPKAEELLKDKSWRPYKPKSSAASDGGVPGGAGAGASTGAREAMHTGSDAGKSSDAGAAGGKDAKK